MTTAGASARHLYSDPRACRPGRLRCGARLGARVRRRADPARWLTPSGAIHRWVAASEGSIVGHALLRQPSFSTVRQRAAELSRLFVTPAAWRKGIATALMRATMRWAVAKDLDLELEVTDHSQAARALYERSGFRLIDTKQADWTTPNGAPVTLDHYASSRERNPTVAQYGHPPCGAKARESALRKQSTHRQS